MAQAKGAAARKTATRGSKAAAAQAERNGQPRTIEFRGITFELPVKLGASIIWRAGITRDDDIGGIARLVESVIGADGFSRVLDKLDADGVTVDDDEALDAVLDLLNRALGEYGLSTGESQASTRS